MISKYKLNQFQQMLWQAGVVKIKGVDVPEKELFALRSGKTSHIYLDMRVIVGVPGAMNMIAEHLQEKLRTEAQITLAQLAIVDSAVSPWLTGAMAGVTNWPGVLVKDARMVDNERGTGIEFYPTAPASRFLPLVMIDDVGTSGSTLKVTRESLTKGFIQNRLGIPACYAALILVREPDLFAQIMSEAQLPYVHLTTLDQLLQTVWKGLSKNLKEAVIKERPFFTS